MNTEEENNVLKQKIEGLEKHVAELEEHLKKYTFNPKNMNDCDTPLWEDKYVVA